MDTVNRSMNRMACFIFAVILALGRSVTILQPAQVGSIEVLAQQIASQTSLYQYDVKTVEGFNMDCLKAIKTKNNLVLGVFHSGIEQSKSGYNALYLAKSQSSSWSKISRLSQRGSQGTIFQVPESSAYLVLYELQNHEKGNTVAIRYYQNTQYLNANNFLYEYQLAQVNGGKKVVNVGTPSVESIELKLREFDPKYNQYRLNIKYHYCPDGQNDYPGLGYVELIPLRDFVDAKGFWVGGCKENYGWNSSADPKVEAAIRKLGIQGKIGQRDMFELQQGGKSSRYYFYEANLNKAFDWHNWRIVLYSQAEDRAVQIPFEFNQVVDLANPHISLLSRNDTTNEYQFWVSFFIPSEGVKPGTGAKAGEFTAQVTLKL